MAREPSLAVDKARAFAYLLPLISVSAAVGLKILFPLLNHTPFGLFLAAIMMSAGLGGLGPGLLATVLAGLGSNYFFFAPFGAFGFAEPMPQVIFLFDGVVVSVGSELLLRARRAVASRNAELTRKNDQLGELHRFRDEMSMLIVHDLKNPLSALLANISYVSDSIGVVDSTIKEALVDSQAAGNRIMRLLANLLDVARIEAGRFQVMRVPTMLETLIHSVLHPRMQLANARRIRLTKNVEPNLYGSLDHDLVARIVENLLDNAIRYTPPGGRIDVGVAEIDGRVQVRVGNSGAAIAAEGRERLFQKFEQASESTSSMNLGLGLYFCRLATEAHGGRIWIEESAALPTVFVVDLGEARDGLRRPLPSLAPAGGYSAEPHRLVVDRVSAAACNGYFPSRAAVRTWR
jgi:K+-sensing histidine kinase KdpD